MLAARVCRSAGSAAARVPRAPDSADWRATRRGRPDEESRLFRAIPAAARAAWRPRGTEPRSGRAQTTEALSRQPTQCSAARARVTAGPVGPRQLRAADQREPSILRHPNIAALGSAGVRHMASVPPSSPSRVSELRQHTKQGRAAELHALLAELAEEKCLYEHVGARDAAGNTAFHLACQHGHIACVRLLEESSSNTFAQNHAGMSGLMMVPCTTSHFRLSPLVHHTQRAGPCGTQHVPLSRSCPRIRLSSRRGPQAAAAGHSELCRHLLPMADLEATCNKGWTAFIHACAGGQADCVEVLVRADCDLKVHGSLSLSLSLPLPLQCVCRGFF